MAWLQNSNCDNAPPAGEEWYFLAFVFINMNSVFFLLTLIYNKTKIHVSVSVLCYNTSTKTTTIMISR